MAKFKTEIPGRYSGDGSLKQFIIPFPYQHRSQVKVEIWDDVTSKWIEQQQGPKGYEFLNDNLIQFFLAPKKSTALYNIQISRNTMISSMLKEFPTDRPGCAGDPSGLSSCTEPDSSVSEPPTGDDGITPTNPYIPDSGPRYGKLVTPDGLSGKPPIVNDILYYFHGCKGEKKTYYGGYGSRNFTYYTAPAIAKWYRKDIASGAVTLLEEQTEGTVNYTQDIPEKFFAYTIQEEDVGSIIFVNVQCYGCGPEGDGLCEVQYGGSTKEVHQHSASAAPVNEQSQLTTQKRLIPVGPGYGTIEVNVNPGVNEDRFIFGGALEEDTGEITSDTVTGTTFKYTKKNDKNYVTVQVIPKSNTSINWEYTVGYTKPIDTTQYKYARWVGKKITHQGAYHLNLASGTSQLYNPVHSEENYTSPWFDYASNSDPTKRYLTIQGMSECGTSGNPIVETKGINPKPSTHNWMYDDWDIFGLIQSNNTNAIPWRSKVWAVNWGKFNAGDFPGLTLGGLGNGTTGSPCGDNPEPKITIPNLVGPEEFDDMYVTFVENGVSIHTHTNTLYLRDHGSDSPTMDYTTSANSYVALDGYWEFSNSEEETKEVQAAWDGVGYNEYAYYHMTAKNEINSTNSIRLNREGTEDWLDWSWMYLRANEEDAFTPWIPSQLGNVRVHDNSYHHYETLYESGHDV